MDDTSTLNGRSVFIPPDKGVDAEADALGAALVVSSAALFNVDSRAMYIAAGKRALGTLDSRAKHGHK